MIVPVDSSVGLEGWSRSGDRIAGAGGLSAAEPGAIQAWVKSDCVAIGFVVVVMGNDSGDAVTACCMTVMCRPDR